METKNLSTLSPFCVAVALTVLGESFAGLRMALGMEAAIAAKNPGFTYAKQWAKIRSL